MTLKIHSLKRFNSTNEIDHNLIKTLYIIILPIPITRCSWGNKMIQAVFARHAVNYDRERELLYLLNFLHISQTHTKNHPLMMF